LVGFDTILVGLKPRSMSSAGSGRCTDGQAEPADTTKSTTPACASPSAVDVPDHCIS
jgi:hypothetical protein